MWGRCWLSEDSWCISKMRLALLVSKLVNRLQKPLPFLSVVIQGQQACILHFTYLETHKSKPPRHSLQSLTDTIKEKQIPKEALNLCGTQRRTTAGDNRFWAVWIPSCTLTWENLLSVSDPHPETYADNWPSWKNGGFLAEIQELHIYEKVPSTIIECYQNLLS